MRLIDADALKEALGIGGDETTCGNCKYLGSYGCREEILMSDVCGLIDKATTVDAIPISFIEKQAATALAYANYMREQASEAETTVLGLLFNQTADGVIDEYTDEATTLTMLITSWNKENDNEKIH